MYVLLLLDVIFLYLKLSVRYSPCTFGLLQEQGAPDAAETVQGDADEQAKNEPKDEGSKKDGEGEEADPRFIKLKVIGQVYSYIGQIRRM